MSENRSLSLSPPPHHLLYLNANKRMWRMWVFLPCECCCLRPSLCVWMCQSEHASPCSRTAFWGMSCRIIKSSHHTGTDLSASLWVRTIASSTEWHSPSSPLRQKTHNSKHYVMHNWRTRSIFACSWKLIHAHYECWWGCDPNDAAFQSLSNDATGSGCVFNTPVMS